MPHADWERKGEAPSTLTETLIRCFADLGFTSPAGRIRPADKKRVDFDPLTKHDWATSPVSGPGRDQVPLADLPKKHMNVTTWGTAITTFVMSSTIFQRPYKYPARPQEKAIWPWCGCWWREGRSGDRGCHPRTTERGSERGREGDRERARPGGRGSSRLPWPLSPSCATRAPAPCRHARV